MSAKNASKVRIIGGFLKRRLIPFYANDGLRPTPDAVRETLFNWCMPFIENALCLDLFAGSGALGFEAASRGAREVVMLEKNSDVFEVLKKNLNEFKMPQVKLYCLDALAYVSTFKKKFDLIFIDPPFFKELINPILENLAKNKFLNNHAHIYIEMEKKHNTLQVPKNWKLKKEKTTSQIKYQLYQCEQVDSDEC